MNEMAGTVFVSPDGTDAIEFGVNIERVWGKVPLDVTSQWRYLADGSDQGTEWQESDFDSKSWNVGSMPFGYGIVHEGTVISPQVTHYFRGEFSLTTSQIQMLAYGEVQLLFDDGVVVYLNGRQVGRSGMVSEIFL